ncbi:hypothetical protein Droror1_Dr00000787 [Drosera rotundifolia]
MMKSSPSSHACGAGEGVSLVFGLWANGFEQCGLRVVVSGPCGASGDSVCVWSAAAVRAGLAAVPVLVVAWCRTGSVLVVLDVVEDGEFRWVGERGVVVSRRGGVTVDGFVCYSVVEVVVSTWFDSDYSDNVGFPVWCLDSAIGGGYFGGGSVRYN